MEEMSAQFGNKPNDTNVVRLAPNQDYMTNSGKYQFVVLPFALALYFVLKYKGKIEGKGKGKCWGQNMGEMGARAKKGQNHKLIE